MQGEPAWEALPRELSPVLRRFLLRCLQKDPALRVRDIGDVRLALDGAFDVAVPANTGTGWLLPVAAAVALTTLAGGLAAWTLWPATPRTLTRFAHVLPAGEPFGDQAHRIVAIAPDGSSIVYAGRDRLYRRRIDELGAVPVRGTEGSPTTPFFSPDGESIGYWDETAGELRRISAAGGTPVVLTPVGALYGAAWQRDETVLYGQEDGIWRVAVTGGAPEQLVRIEPGELAYGPQALDGTRILFSVVRRVEMSGRTGWDNARVMVQSIGSSDRRHAVHHGLRARHAGCPSALAGERRPQLVEELERLVPVR